MLNHTGNEKLSSLTAPTRSPLPRAPGATTNAATTHLREAAATLSLLLEGLHHLLPLLRAQFARAVWSGAKGSECCGAGLEGEVADGKQYLWG